MNGHPDGQTSTLRSATGAHLLSPPDRLALVNRSYPARVASQTSRAIAPARQCLWSAAAQTLQVEGAHQRGDDLRRVRRPGPHTASPGTYPTPDPGQDRTGLPGVGDSVPGPCAPTQPGTAASAPYILAAPGPPVTSWEILRVAHTGALPLRATAFDRVCASVRGIAGPPARDAVW
jgi:hypothetical protein